MQKVINVLAVLSFLGTASIIGGGAYVYMNREALAEQAKERITKAATEAIAGALPGMLDAAMPKLPEVTGGAMPTAGDTPGVPAGLPGF
tara:strand:+ start:670 stop:936 length:267 start_codon:yes stop_codon:yes gene_type:complete